MLNTYYSYLIFTNMVDLTVYIVMIATFENTHTWFFLICSKFQLKKTAVIRRKLRWFTFVIGLFPSVHAQPEILLCQVGQKEKPMQYNFDNTVILFKKKSSKSFILSLQSNDLVVDHCYINAWLLEQMLCNLTMLQFKLNKTKRNIVNAFVSTELNLIIFLSLNYACKCKNYLR